jgi:hypothetical protein
MSNDTPEGLSCWTCGSDSYLVRPDWSVVDMVNLPMYTCDHCHGPIARLFMQEAVLDV